MICDLAETYGIYDYRQHPPTRVAVFVLGLGGDSRVSMAIIGVKYKFDTMLNAAMFDVLHLLLWQNTKHARKGNNFPKSIVKMMYGEKECRGFDSSEAFESERKRILNLIEGGD